MNMLPSDRYLCSLLGISEEEFIEFKAAARRHLKENPIEGPVAGDPATAALYIAIANLVIGLGSIAVSLLLRPSIPKQKQPGQVNTVDISQDPVQSNTSFAPRYGFDSVQAVTKLGETIPLVYGNRNVDGDKIGGVRVNMPMIWSQVLSFGTSQMLRAVFLVSEADLGNPTTGGLDDDLWAIGSNSLKNYKFDYGPQTRFASRVTETVVCPQREYALTLFEESDHLGLGIIVDDGLLFPHHKRGVHWLPNRKVAHREFRTFR